MYDVFFISYDEHNADENWDRLLLFAPLAQRIHGVTGILNAHKSAAERSRTDAFFVVDGDAWLLPNWSFTGEEFDEFEPYEGKNPADCVIVWKSHNPYNGLEYGYGGIKLMSKRAMLKANHNVDIATTVSDCFLSADMVACETRFASSPWHAWRGAFRECAKLASSSLGNTTSEQQHWLDIWTSTAEGPYQEYILAGARSGRDYGSAYKNDKEVLGTINSYDQLRKIYEESFQ